MRFLLLLGLLCTSLLVSATDTVYSFAKPEQQKLYNELIVEFRCLVCQNQNIADSDADLAKDLRQKTYELITQGKQETEIKAFMQARYGDFVLYSPPLTTTTWLLWALPLVVLFIALGFIYLGYRRYKKEQGS